MSACTLQGNLTADPELRYTPSGTAVVNFKVADTDRYRDATGEYKDAGTVFLSVVAFGGLAEHVAEACAKGTAVVVVGRLAQREWEAEDGSRRSRIECRAENVGVALRTQRATVAKATRTTASAVRAAA